MIDSLEARTDSVPQRWALLVAACLPPLFVHVTWQPGLAVRLGHADVNAYLSDFAVVAIAIVALAAGRRLGFAPLRAARWIWIAILALLAWTFVAVAYGRLEEATYPWQTHGVTAAKFAEYAVLAFALPLVVRTLGDMLALLWSLTLTSVAATAVGLAQFFGASILLHGRVGGRQGSFLSISDFAALSSVVLVVGLVALAAPRLGLGRRLGAVATASGLLGTILAAAVASLLGLATACAALALVLVRRRELDVRRLAVVGAATVVAALGVLAARGGDLGSFARFVSTSRESPSARQATVQTYAHRTLLAWIGLRIWGDHPIVGAGWQAAGDPATFEPYVPAAHRRFPNEPPLAFPTRAHPYNTQNLWIEALADMGIVGLGLLVAMFAAVGLVAWRSIRAAPAVLGLCATALLVWLWTAQSFVAGIPLDAITWLAFGLAATGAAWTGRRRPSEPLRQASA